MSYIKIKNFSSIKEHIKKNTLVVFDIDETIGKFNNNNINKKWWLTYKKKHFLKYGNYIDVNKCGQKEWFKYNANIKFLHTDKQNLVNIIQETRNKYNKVVAVTARYNDHKHLTLKQLYDLDIKFDNIHDSNETYESGIFFAGDESKGNIILDICRTSNIKNVVFIDDKYYNLKDVYNKLKSTNINLYLYQACFV
jgi:hypothetical protein